MGTAEDRRTRERQRKDKGKTKERQRKDKGKTKIKEAEYILRRAWVAVVVVRRAARQTPSVEARNPLMFLYGHPYRYLAISLLIIS